MNHIYIIMGKSASGKDSIYQQLKDKLNGSVKEIITYTTRPIRSGERNGKEYIFSTEKEYKKSLDENKIIEQRSYNTAHGLWRYFTVDDGQIDLQQNSYIMINTLEAYISIREYFGSDYVVPIYVEVETGERLQRALDREKQQIEPKYKELCRRFLADEDDFSEQRLKESGIHKRYHNIDIDTCVEEIFSKISFDKKSK